MAVQSNAGQTYSGKYFLQTVDINLNNVKWVSIKNFSGTYDGGNHTIANLDCYENGLFATATTALKNIKLSGVTFSATYNQSSIVASDLGALAGIVRGTGVVNCHVEDVNISPQFSSSGSYTAGNNMYIGGLVGSSNGSITDCSVKGMTIKTNAQYVAGLVAYHGISIDITNCVVEDFDITSSNASSYVSGIMTEGSSTYTATINNCKVGQGSLRGYHVAGIAYVKVNNTSCFVSADLYGKWSSYGFCSGGSATECYFNGTISIMDTTNYISIFISHNGSSVMRCMFNGKVVGNPNNPSCYIYLGSSGTYYSHNSYIGGEYITNGAINLHTYVGGYQCIVDMQTVGTANLKMHSSYETDCYINEDKTGQVYASTGLLSAQTLPAEDLRSPTLYQKWIDFDTYWMIDRNINDGIPILRAFYDVAVVTGFDGEGTQASPYIIENAAGFVAFAKTYLDDPFIGYKYWKIADGVTTLDLSNHGSWRPFTFNGYLMGNKCNITGLTIDENYARVGLFASLSAGAVVEWLSVYGNVDYDYAKYTGGLVGFVSQGALVSNCYFEGNITGYMNSYGIKNVGALVGYTETNDVASSYAKVVHTRHYINRTVTNNISQVYVVGLEGQLCPNVTSDYLEDLGFDTTDTGWGDFTQTEIASANFSIKRNISGKGAILATAGGENVAFDNDDVSVNTYKKGTEVIVEATASTGYAIKSIIIGGTEYASAVNQNSIVLVYSTANVSKELPIVVVFDNQYSITISNGTHSDQGSTTVSGSNITTTNPYKALKSTSITTTSTATTNTSTLKSYITGVTIDGTLVNISSADNTTTTHTINGITYTIARTKTTGFSTQIVTKVVITCSLTKSITISTHYNAQQSVSTSVTLVGGDGNTTSTPTGTITADWGSTTNTLTKTEQTGKTFIGWVVNGQIESQEDTFSTQVTSSTTTITELWAVMYNISLTLPSGTESIRVAHAMTGLIYNLSTNTALMAGEWIVYIPDGYTLKVNGSTVAKTEGLYIVTISADSTIAIV
ncbi:MAG: GLUG motif-containing protein [Clostridia bacterium]